MTCHHLEGRNPAHTVQAGHDKFDKTFFIRVYVKDLPDDQPERPVFQAGSAEKPVTHVDDLAELLREYANPFHINDELLGEIAATAN